MGWFNKSLKAVTKALDQIVSPLEATGNLVTGKGKAEDVYNVGVTTFTGGIMGGGGATAKMTEKSAVSAGVLPDRTPPPEEIMKAISPEQWELYQRGYLSLGQLKIQSMGKSAIYQAGLGKPVGDSDIVARMDWEKSLLRLQEASRLSPGTGVGGKMFAQKEDKTEPLFGATGTVLTSNMAKKTLLAG